MKVQCFIDGYNLYHAVDDLKIPKLHWVNLRNLVQSYIPKQDELNDVFYFTAKPTHLTIPVQSRHESLRDALTFHDVKIVEGQFKRKQLSCRAIGSDACKQKYYAHEEKESDVNLAIQLVSEAYQGNFDIAIVVTADSDLIPPVKFVRDNFPEKEVWILSPPNRSKRSGELIGCAKRGLEMTAKQMRKHIMHEKLIAGGELIAERPSFWSKG